MIEALAKCNECQIRKMTTFFRHLWRHNYVISDVNNLKIYKILQHNVIHVFANFYSYGYCWTYYTSVKCLKLLSGLQITNVLNLVCKMSKSHDKIFFFHFHVFQTYSSFQKGITCFFKLLQTEFMRKSLRKIAIFTAKISQFLNTFSAIFNTKIFSNYLY